LEKISETVLKEAKEKILNRIYTHHLRPWQKSEENIFFISDAYPGVWLEHTFDAIAWADYMPIDHVVSANQVRLFIRNQKESGQLPCFIWRENIGYSQLQECVSFGNMCLKACRQNPQDQNLLSESYRAVVGWMNWLEENRMPNHLGLVEMFCGYDTGHDNSGPLTGMTYQRNHPTKSADFLPEDDDVLPVVAPDINACYYGNAIALSEMAKELKLTDEVSFWRNKAEEIRKKYLRFVLIPRIYFSMMWIRTVVSERLSPYPLQMF